MQVKIWGARGSLPAPILPVDIEKHVWELFRTFFATGHSKVSEVGPFLLSLPRHQFGGYGGNTPCVEVKTPGSHVIVDGGSGIRLLGYEMLSGPCGRGQGEVHIFFTHFHWDHLIGLPFFTPLFIPGNRIHVYAVQPDLPEVFATLFKKPYFPVPLTNLGAKIEYHSLEPRKPFVLGDTTITPYQLDHPDPCWGYKFESGGRSFAHCVDTECTRVTREQLGEDLGLYQSQGRGVDAMLFDAQYTLMETIEKVNWGHATASLGIDIAMREGIKKMILMHHDPASSNAKIANAEAQARRYYDSQMKEAGRQGVNLHPVEWVYAFDGMTLDV